MDIKINFEKETGVSLYKAFELFGMDIGVLILDDDILELELKTNNKATLEAIEKIKELILKNSLFEDRWKQEAITYSLERCILGQARRNKLQFYSEWLYEKNIIIHNLVQHSLICFNPLILSNNNKITTCKCIFKPSKELLERYDFINPVYSGNSYKVLYYEINIQKMKGIQKIYINEGDILELNYPMYHPLIWGYIQKNNFNLLTI